MLSIAWIAIKLFFSSLIKKVLQFGAWLVKHPKVLCIFLGLALGFAGGWFATLKVADAKVSKMERRLQDINDQAKIEADRIKKDSTTEADKLETKIAELQEQLAGTVADYEDKLKVALKSEKVKIVKVQVPGQTTTVDVAFENGKNVCRTLPSAFKDQMDELVRKAEEELK